MQYCREHANVFLLSERSQPKKGMVPFLYLCLYGILEKSEPQRQKAVLRLPGAIKGVRVDCKGAQGNCKGGMEFFYLLPWVLHAVAKIPKTEPYKRYFFLYVTCLLMILKKNETILFFKKQ